MIYSKLGYLLQKYLKWCIYIENNSSKDFDSWIFEEKRFDVDVM